MSNLIAIDWGTSSFRAYLIDDGGNVLQKVSSQDGILSVADRAFEQSLNTQLRVFKDTSPQTPIIAAGMITSKNGWCETPYISCPAGTQALAENLKPLETRSLGKIWFVPGVNQLQPVPDIMRGEESQLAGMESGEDVVAIMPGTHSKWVRIKDGIITCFKTYMTGELFSIISKHSILKPPPDTVWDDRAFKKGVREGFSLAEEGHTLLSGLFQVRVQVILGQASEKNVSCHLSGLLIGCEIAEAGRGGYNNVPKKLIIGEARLAALYHLALFECGLDSEIASEDLSAHGLYQIAKHKLL